MNEETTKLAAQFTEYSDHHAVIPLHDAESGMRGFIAIHAKRGGHPSFGATRIWQYEKEEDALRDALRLSKMMSYKAALAGLPCGGAKAVLLQNEAMNHDRERVLRAYAKKLNAFQDRFITGTDVGLNQSELPLLHAHTPNIVGFNDNSSEFTVRGIYLSILQTLSVLFDSEKIHGRTFAIQGLGKIGSGLLRSLYADAATIYVSDTDARQLEQVRKHFPNAIVVSPEEIHTQSVDVFCPCALAYPVNEKSISELACKAIVGGANNQLETDTLGYDLLRRNILYAPDYVVNAGGIIAVFDEYEHAEYDYQRVHRKVMGIKNMLQNIFTQSHERNIPTNIVANKMAEVIIAQ